MLKIFQNFFFSRLCLKNLYGEYEIYIRKDWPKSVLIILEFVLLSKMTMGQF